MSILKRQEEKTCILSSFSVKLPTAGFVFVFVFVVFVFFTVHYDIY